MMRNIVVLFVMLSALLAGCTVGESADVEPTLMAEVEADAPALESITPGSNEEYPAPTTGSGYPLSPEEAGLPTSYPERTVIAPSGEVDPNELTPITPDTTLRAVPSPGRPGTAQSPQLSLMLEAVAQDLNAQIDVPVHEIRLVAAEPTVWPNGGLGCPVEGMAYTEVLVEGMLIILDANGKTYTYHTDAGRNFVLCQNGRPVSTGFIPQR